MTYLECLWTEDRCAFNMIYRLRSFSLNVGRVVSHHHCWKAIQNAEKILHFWACVEGFLVLFDMVAGLVQWWERSPPTNVSRVRFPDPGSYVGWVCCWFSTLLREVFLRVLRFSPLLKNQPFQIPIRSWNARAFLNEFFELLGAPWVNRLHLHYIYNHRNQTTLLETRNVLLGVCCV